MSSRCFCVTVDMEGILQGVGFRPTMRRLATQAGLSGWVQNRSGTVRLHLGGERAELRHFLAELPDKLPPRARLDRMSASEPAPCAESECAGPFEIRESEGDRGRRVAIPADLALCEDCRREVFDPASRFFGYPFTTCTNCGPRYTVVDAMPYDRERTALSLFPLCEECRGEYEDPDDRRYHAESIACPRCGPSLRLLDASGALLAADAGARTLGPGSPLRRTRALLAEGAVVAVKGLGGYLLACDALAPRAIRALRERKRRPSKPFAVMARSLPDLRGYAHVPDAAAELLAGPRGPIVVVEPRADAEPPLPVDLLAPDTGDVGAMLPTTALHALLFDPLPGDPLPPFDLLVMTSGNRGGEPIAIEDGEALERLAGIADAFLAHDRPVRLRNDDSLVALALGAPQVWRRARGYAPESLRLARPLERSVLGMGAELKNTIAVGRDAEIVPSPHVGDLETPEAVDGLERVLDRLPAFLRTDPQAVAVDLHPDMHATRIGRRVAVARDLPLVEVQHHHAHAAALLAEHGVERAIALVMDGTGLGPDGAIWGAEALVADARGYRRAATFAPVPLPGGDAAVLRPARQLLARFLDAGLELDGRWLARLGVEEREAAVWRLQAQKGLNAPPTHAAGRLFDAFATALGLAPDEVSYEAQAAIRLEGAARRAAREGPAVPFASRRDGELLVLDWRPAFDLVHSRGVDARRRGDVEALALAFHGALARACVAMAEAACAASGLQTVGLTGGCFMNRVLTRLAHDALVERGFRVLIPRLLPPNDGGVAAGQVLVAGGSS